jgi:type VI secretion system protein VasJ
VERFQQKMKNSSSRREKLLWRLALSQSLVSAKQSKLALPHLEEVLNDIDTYRLEEYDPPLALQGLKMVWLGLNSQADARSKEKAAETLKHIARLDLTEVIRMGKA